MWNIGSPATLLRTAMFVVAIGMTSVAFSDVASAESRLFSCPHAQVITLTPAGPGTISADPINGKPMQMRRDPGNPLRFSNGPNSVLLTADQGALTLQVPKKETAKCLYGTVNVKPFIP